MLLGLCGHVCTSMCSVTWIKSAQLHCFPFCPSCLVHRLASSGLVLFLFRTAVTIAKFSVAWIARNQWCGVSETWRLGLLSDSLSLCLYLSLCVCTCTVTCAHLYTWRPDVNVKCSLLLSIFLCEMGFFLRIQSLRYSGWPVSSTYPSISWDFPFVLSHQAWGKHPSWQATFCLSQVTPVTDAEEVLISF